MITATQGTFDRVLEVLEDGKWHTEDELAEVSYFPREWVKELDVSGYPVTIVESGLVRLRLAESAPLG
jgi:hypothetical protein